MDYGTSMVLRSDDSILLAGYGYDGELHRYGIACLSPDGTLNEEFGSGGKTHPITHISESSPGAEMMRGLA
jgi:hypothetical protein